MKNMNRMKKHRTAMPMLALVLFFCGLILPAFSQSGRSSTNPSRGNRIIKTNWSGDMMCMADSMSTLCVQMDNNDSLEIKLVVRTGVPDITPFPPMRFTYHIRSNPQSVVPDIMSVTDEVTNSMLAPVVLDDGSLVWQAEFPLKFAVNGCAVNIDSFILLVDYRLIHLLNPPPAWEPYPMAAHPLLFPPDIFEVPNPAPNYEESKWICCSGVGGDCPPTTPLIVNPNGHGQFSPNIAGHSRQAIVPNPFRNQSMVFWEQDSPIGQVQLRVYDAYGKLMAAHSYGPEKTNRFEAEIQTGQWPPGLYYFHLMSGQSTAVIKSIKVD